MTDYVITPTHYGVLREENLRRGYDASIGNGQPIPQDPKLLKRVKDPSIPDEVNSRQNSRPVEGNAVNTARASGLGGRLDEFG